MNLTKGAGGVASAGRTKLDKERIRLCLREIEHIGNIAKNIKPTVCKSSIKEKLRTTKTFHEKLKNLLEDVSDLPIFL